MGAEATAKMGRYAAKKAERARRTGEIERNMRKANAGLIQGGLPRATANEFAKGIKGQAAAMRGNERRAYLKKSNVQGLQKQLDAGRSAAKTAYTQKTVAAKAASKKATMRAAKSKKKGKTK